jgi:UDP-glucose 4-epimerase
VLHEAALASVTFSVDDPLTAHDVNVTGTLNMLLAARDAHVQRFVLASSCAVYGDNPNLPLREDMATNPLSPYAVSKLAGEDYCRTFFKVYGLPTVALRYFNVFGPRQDPDSEYSAVIPKFIDRAIRGSPLIIYGDGQQSRDFVYVSNVVEANLLACQVPDAAGQVVNVSAGKRYSLLDLVHALEPLVGDGSLTVEHQPARTGDILHSEGDISKAKQVLQYEPQVDFETGLRKTVMFVKG